MRTRSIAVLVMVLMVVVGVVLGLALAVVAEGRAADPSAAYERPPPTASRSIGATRSAPPAAAPAAPARPPVAAPAAPAQPSATVRRTARSASPEAPETEARSRTAVRLYLQHGEQVESVTRSVVSTPRIGGAVLDALIAGPTPQESAREFASMIPEPTRVRSLVIDAGIASIDLSRHFLSPADGFTTAVRFAQVACTLTQFSTVDGVRFTVDGTPVDAPVAGTTAVRRPVECLDYAWMVPTHDIGVRAGIWPFTDQTALDAYARGSDATYRDPGETARLFAIRYVGMRDVTVAGIDAAAGRAVVDIARATGEGDRPLDEPQPAMSVVLQQFGPHDGPWTVTDAAAPRIEIHAPSGARAITSPANLRGAASAYEGTVQVEVRQDGMRTGEALGRGFVTGSGSPELGPFSGSVAFAQPSASAGAVVLYEASVADAGSQVIQAAVRRVMFAH